MPVAREWEQAGRYPTEIVDGMKAMGLFGITVPEEYGGLDLDPVSFALVFEEIARGWMGIAGILGSHSLACRLIAMHGTEEQKQQYLPDLATGVRRSGIGLTEPDAGTDLQGIRTTARLEGDHYVVNGAKMWITNARYADPLPVLVKTDPTASPAHQGMSVLLIEPDTPGYEVTKDIPKLGYKGTESCEILLTDVRVPVSQLVGGVEGRGMQQVLSALEWGRVNIAARSVGIAQRAHDEALAYAQQRKAFGQPISDFQAIQLKLGELGTQVQAARLMAYWARRRRTPRARRRRHRHGQDLLLRGGAAGRDRRDEGARRLRLLDGVRGRAALPRLDPDEHRRGHQRHPAHRRREVAASRGRPVLADLTPSGSRAPRSTCRATRRTSSPRALERGADEVIVDLEDAVAPAAKDRARETVRVWLHDLPVLAGVGVWVRVNSGAPARGRRTRGRRCARADRHHGRQGRDADELVDARPAAVSLRLDRRASCRCWRARRAILRAGEIGRGAAGAAAADRRGRPARRPRHHARVRTSASCSSPARRWCVASAAAGIAPPIAPVSTNFRDLDAFRESTEALARLGFVGRACIHPAQVAVANEVFTPTQAEVDSARARRLARFEGGRAVGVDADGHFVDEAVLRQARRLLTLVR